YRRFGLLSGDPVVGRVIPSSIYSSPRTRPRFEEEEDEDHPHTQSVARASAVALLDAAGVAERTIPERSGVIYGDEAAGNDGWHAGVSRTRRRRRRRTDLVPAR